MTKTFKRQAAQGDMLITKIDSMPKGAKPISSEGGKFILAHSETGHHHTVKKTKGVSFFSNDNNPFIAYLVVDNTKCYVEHERSFDKHETLKFPPGIFEIRRQREYTPEGFRRAQD